MFRLLRWIAGPFLAVITGCIAYGAGLNALMSKTIGITSLMIYYWIENSLRMGLIGLFPIVLLPLFNIVNGSKVSQLYFSDSVIVCMGSLILAQSIEQYQIHLLLARMLLSKVIHTGLHGILGAFITITGFLSMWLSNTATAALMIPMSNAIIQSLLISIDSKSSKQHKFNKELIFQLGKAIDLSIAYAASLGGMATLTGTGSNLVLQGTLTSMFGIKNTITYLEWVSFATPLSWLNLLCLWMILSVIYLRQKNDRHQHHQTINPLEQLVTESPMTLYSQTKESNNNLMLRGTTTTTTIATVASSSMIRDGDKSDSSASDGKIDDQIEMIELSVNYDNNHHTCTDNTETDNDHHQQEVAFDYPAQSVAVVFALMAILWMTRDPPGGWGWARLVHGGGTITDGTVAMGCCLYLMLMPKEPPPSLTSMIRSIQQSIAMRSYTPLTVHQTAENIQSTSSGSGQLTRKKEYEAIIPWRVIQKLHWDILFLLGGGFALSSGFQASGLSEFIGDTLTSSGPASLSAFIIISSLLACLATNFMSNIAAANVLLSALACVAPEFDRHPLALLAPVTFSISLAFLFPIGTPPNAMVIANEKVSLAEFAVVGMILTVVYLIVILLYSLFILPMIFDVNNLPESIRDVCDSR